MTQLVWGDYSSSPPSEEIWVPSVDSSELKKVWNIGQDTLANASGRERVDITRRDYPGVSSAAWFRAAILQAAKHLGLLPPELPKVHDAVFNVAARIPMKHRTKASARFPLDLDEFMNEIESELRRLG